MPCERPRGARRRRTRRSARRRSPRSALTRPCRPSARGRWRRSRASPRLRRQGSGRAGPPAPSEGRTATGSAPGSRSTSSTSGGKSTTVRVCTIRRRRASISSLPAVRASTGNAMRLITELIFFWYSTDSWYAAPVEAGRRGAERRADDRVVAVAEAGPRQRRRASQDRRRAAALPISFAVQRGSGGGAYTPRARRPPPRPARYPSTSADASSPARASTPRSWPCGSAC